MVATKSPPKIIPKKRYATTPLKTPISPTTTPSTERGGRP